MPQSLSSILIHLVFSTKNREPFITPAIEAELHPYMATILRDHDSPSLIIDGTADHIHALFALSRKVTIADLVEELKTSSSKWIKTKGRVFRNFHWQRGYGAFSVGQSFYHFVCQRSYCRHFPLIGGLRAVTLSENTFVRETALRLSWRGPTPPDKLHDDSGALR